MTAVRAGLAVAILMLGIWAHTNPEVLDEWIGNPSDITEEESELVGLQENEEWLVLRVEFEGRPFAQQKANSCLLYTSPSPRDRTRSRMPSSA